MTRNGPRLAVVVVSLLSAAGCGNRTQPSPPPSTTTPPVTSTPPRLVGVRIDGPELVEPGSKTQYRAIAQMSDNTTQDYTQGASWRVTWSGSGPVAAISATGLLTANKAGEIQIQAQVPGFLASQNLLLLPAGTFRLTGMVSEAGLPLSEARVTVVSGTGTGLNALTDYYGTYRLYGVAGSVQVEVSKPGYDALVRQTIVSENALLDFSDVRQAGGIGSYAGTYTLTFKVAPNCWEDRVFGGSVSKAFPPDMRERRYTATVKQDGIQLSVSLSNASFVNGLGMPNSFSGRIEPGRVTFNLGRDYNYYFADLNFLELASEDTAFSFYGVTRITPDRGQLVSSFSGTAALIPVKALTGTWIFGNACNSASHIFDMIRQDTAPSRLRRR
jgi:hypothetical protein